MYISFLFQGIIIGISVAAPLGPIGVLCINRTLENGFINGFISGLGAATADLFYGIIAALGISILSSFLLQIQFPIRIIGILFILFLGLKYLFKKERNNKVIKNNKTIGISSYTTTFILTLTNPLTILFFTGIIAGMGIIQNNRSNLDSIFLISGIFVGSLIWWFILSTITSLLRKRIENKYINLLNKISGIILIGFSIYLSFSFFNKVTL